jgi:NAD-dependent dihydropyrimidine dehydrogenase PreA subunit
MQVPKKIIQIDEDKCNGCGRCVRTCAGGAIEIRDGKARLIADNYCDGLGACLEKCPRNALQLIDRKIEEVPEIGSEGQTHGQKRTPATLACGCPSINVQSFKPGTCQKVTGGETAQAESTLTNWPIKLRLVPPDASFLHNGELLILADCTAVALPQLHPFMAGKIVLTGCPKFDDANANIQKLASIFASAGIKQIAIGRMEVPCCAGLSTTVHRALHLSGQKIPLEEVVVSVRGKVIDFI